MKTKVFVNLKDSQIAKVIVGVVLLINILLMVMMLQSCGGKGDDPAPVEEKETDKIAKLLSTGGTWAVQSVIVDGVEKTSVYKDLKLTFTTTGYTTTGGGAVWPASGTWKFTDDTAKVIERNDGLLINLSEVSENKLVLGLQWSKSTLGPGRAASVAGQHVFTLLR
jgi:hypothetical protein